MNKTFSTFLFLWVLALCSNLVSGQTEPNTHYLISSGSSQGVYYKTTNDLIGILQKEFPNIEFVNIQSNGSIENIRNLKSRFADFGISQRNIFIENVYTQTEAVRNVDILLPLFQEKFRIYTKRKGLDSAKKRLAQVSKVGVTSKAGYSYLVFIEVCKLLNIDISAIEFKEADYDTLAEMLAKGEIDMVTSFSSEIKQIAGLEGVKEQYFSKAEIDLIQERIANTFGERTPSGLYSLGSWSFLVGLQQSVEQIEEATGKSVVKTLIEGIERDTSQAAFDKYRKALKNFKKPDYQRLLTLAPLNQELASHLDMSNKMDDYSFLLWILPLAALIVAFVKVWASKHEKIKERALWLRYRHFIIGLAIIIFLYFVCVEGIIYAESKLYQDIHVKSQLLNMSKLDVHFWLVITNLTGINNGVFPLSDMGQILLSVSSYVLWINALVITVLEFMFYRISKNRLMGLNKLTCKNHIVVAGWNNRTPELLKELANVQLNFENQSRQIVCIVENSEELMKHNSDLKLLNDSRKISFIAGDAREDEALSKANISKAKSVILLADSHNGTSDEKTLLRALSISRHCKRKKIRHDKERTTYVHRDDNQLYHSDNHADNIYIIAELNDKRFQQDLFNAEVNEVINSGDYGKNAITQSLMNHGVSKVLDEILTYNDQNEFYTIDLREERYKEFRGKTYDELLMLLRKKRIMLIGIKIVYSNQYNEEIIDQGEIQALLEKEKLFRQIIVNPIDENEIKRPTDADDQLFVFARNKKELDFMARELVQM